MEVKLLTESAKMPTKAYAGDACWDLYCDDHIILAPGARALVSTGIAIELPPNTDAFIWDRSGISSKQGVHVLGGVIDNGYRGEIKVCLINLDIQPLIYGAFWGDPYPVNKNSDNIFIKHWEQHTHEFNLGDKIAQLHLVQKADSFMLAKKVDKLSDTVRDNKGFGSSGS